MVITQMMEGVRGAFLGGASLGRLGYSLDDQPVPLYYLHEPNVIYARSGKRPSRCTRILAPVSKLTNSHVGR